MPLTSKNLPCFLCSEPRNNGAALIYISHFEQNQKSPLFNFSGACVHASCFEAHPLQTEVLARVALAERYRESEKRCPHCGQTLERKDLVFTTGFLTGDRAHPLFGFNYLTFHEDHLEQWSRYEEFTAAVRAYVESGEYDGPPLLPSLEPYQTSRFKMGRAYKIKK